MEDKEERNERTRNIPLHEKSTTTLACSLSLANSFGGVQFSQPVLPLVFSPAVMINPESIIADGFVNELPMYLRQLSGTCIGFGHFATPAAKCRKGAG